MGLYWGLNKISAVYIQIYLIELILQEFVCNLLQFAPWGPNDNTPALVK